MKVIGLLINYIAETAIGQYRIVAFGANDGVVKEAGAATDALIGVTEGFDYQIGDRPDVVRSGMTEVEYGGVVTRGDPLTSDADGRAIKAVPAAGANVRIIGHAEVSGVLGDIGSVMLGASSLQG